MRSSISFSDKNKFAMTDRPRYTENSSVQMPKKKRDFSH